MHKAKVCQVLVASLLVSFAAHAQDAQSILAKARELQLARWDGVDSYTVEQTVAGTKVVMDYIRVDETSFRVVPKANMVGMTDASGDGAIADFDDIQKLAKTAEFLGTESVGDREGFHLKADDVDHQQVAGERLKERNGRREKPLSTHGIARSDGDCHRVAGTRSRQHEPESADTDAEH